MERRRDEREQVRLGVALVFLSSGHFPGGVGIRHFLDVHRHALVRRVTALLTAEHVGCMEWLPNSRGTIAPTGVSTASSPPVSTRPGWSITS